MGRGLLLLPLIFLITLFFQACTSNKAIDFHELKTEVNGEGYTGKPNPYDFINPNEICSETGANGNPLPSSQIFIFPTGGAQLVREHCVDIAPRNLSQRDYTINSNGDIIYQNQIFSSNLNPTPFDVVAASCPAGKTMLANPVRTSIMHDPLDLLTSQWEKDALSVTLEGSLASLPVYKIERTDPNALESWHRVAQSPTLTAGENYVFSFFVKTHPTEKVKFLSYFPNVQNLEIDFDLTTGASVIMSSFGAQAISTKAEMFGGGLYINIYFQSVSDVIANVGMASTGQFVGSSVSATALQLEKVSNFCSP